MLDSQVQSSRKRRVDRREGHTLFLATGRNADFYFGMSKEKLYQFERRITGCPENRNACHVE